MCRLVPCRAGLQEGEELGTSKTVGTIPMAAPDISEADVEAVARVVDECRSDRPMAPNGRLSIGPRIEQFECELADYAGAPFGVGVSSGTAGLHLAVIAAGIGPGDVVITTPFSFVSSSNAILFERGVPLFVDIDPETLNLDVEGVREAVDDLKAGGERARRRLPPSMREAASDFDPGRLKALLPVHVFGQPADMPAVFDIAQEHDLAVIEDACEAIGAEAHGYRAGACGAAPVPEALYDKHAACFAFYPNKQITTGEGGMLVTGSEQWAQLFRSLRNQGRDDFGPWLDHHRLGFNYRLDELSAALGISQLARIDEILEHRAAVAAWYAERLQHIAGVEAPRVASATTDMSWFVYVARLEDDIDRDAVSRDLAEAGVPSRTYFPPIHLQSFYRNTFGYEGGEFPRTEAASDRTLALPFFTRMTSDQVDYVCEHIASAIGEQRT